MTMEKDRSTENELKSDSIDSLTDVTSSSTTTSVCDSKDSSQSTPERYTSIHKYEEQWHKIYDFYDDNWTELRRKAVVGRLRSSRFRSVCWRALLGVLPQKTSSWIETIRDQRQRYGDLKTEMISDPRQNKISDDDPLSQNDESLWNKHFCDQELIGTIKQDVVRTFPGVDFFRREDIQNIMVSILFCYAREHPAMCYRQGMHEILAPLLFVLYSDHQSMLHVKEQALINDVIAEILNPQYLEADSFTLFTHIMSSIECCYRIHDMMPTTGGYFPPVTKIQSEEVQNYRPENEVVTQLNWIRMNLLSKYDPELKQHLEKLDIPLPLFGIRWLRLLFGREFALLDLLVLWDAIFAEGDNFGLVNFVVVAMLMAIRDELLVADYTTCLTLLMRYPPAVDITYIIEHALHLMHPKLYALPTATSYITLPTTLSQTPTTIVNKETIASIRRNSVFDRTASVKRNNSSTQIVSGDQKGVVDGFSIEEFNSIRSDLHHAYSVMSLSRIKLLQYLSILRKGLPPGTSREAIQALDGIQELCSLLKHSNNSTGSSLSDSYIERAYEADERFVKQIAQRDQNSSSPSKTSKSVFYVDHIPNIPIRQSSYKSPHKMPQKAEVPMQVFNENLAVKYENTKGVPLEDPTGLRPGKSTQDKSEEWCSMDFKN